jgi:glycogen synthase
MRVLFVSQEYPPETGWGGIGTYVAMVSRALAERGIEVDVLSVVEGQSVSTSELAGVTVHRCPLPPVGGPRRRLPEAWVRVWLPITVARQIRRLGLRPSVVECPDWKAEGFALALRGTIPLVVRLHSSARQLFPYTGQGKDSRGLDGRLAARLEEATVRRANVVVSTGSNLAEVAPRIGLDEGALHPIPAAVRLPPARPFPDSAEPRVTFVGRLEPRKAPEVVLRAAPGVLSVRPDARFVFVGRDVGDAGTPPSSMWLRNEAERLGVAHAVELRGELDWAGVADELRRATVCAVPSRWECFPNVVAEASAVGRPVVVSAISAFSEMVEDNITGRIVPSEDPEAWASTIGELLSRPEQARAMGSAGSAHIRRVSDPARLAELALDAYKHAIERWRNGERAGR